MAFGKQLDDLTLKYMNRLGSIQKDSCLNVSTLTHKRTPVDKGSLRRSWTPSVGEVETDNIDASTSGKRHDIPSVVDSLKLGDTYNYANGQPYVRRIEYEGYSPQAPSGMMRRSTAEWQKIVRKAVKDNK